jgi:cytoskeleton protein RodZ
LPNPVADGSKLEPSPTSTAETRQPSAPAVPGSAPESAVAAATAPAATAAESAPAAATAPAPLQLAYRGPSWTEIRDRDGQVLISRLVAAGSEQTVRGAAPFDIVIGNAAAVTLTYRGKPVDLTRHTRQNFARLKLS